MSKDVRGLVSTPRLYVDYVQYFLATGYIDSFTAGDVIGSGAANVWDFNPSKVTTFYPDDSLATASLQWISFYAVTKHNNTNIPVGLQARWLMSTMNYFMVLGHNVGIANQLAPNPNIHLKCIGYDTDDSSLQNFTNNKVDVVGNMSSGANDLGYSVQTFDGFGDDYNPFNLESFDKIGFLFQARDSSENGYWTSDHPLKIGALSCGRYFDFPHSVDMNLSTSIEHPEMKTERTAGGSDIVSKNHYRQNRWVDENGYFDLPAWTHIDLDDYVDNGIAREDALRQESSLGVGRTGKRAFNLKFSFLSKDDTFPKNFEDSMGGVYDPVLKTFDAEDNLLSAINYSLGFKIPIIIQPSNDKQDFAIVTGSDIKISQQAPYMYQFSIILREV